MPVFNQVPHRAVAALKGVGQQGVCGKPIHGVPNQNHRKPEPFEKGSGKHTFPVRESDHSRKIQRSCQCADGRQSVFIEVIRQRNGDITLLLYDFFQLFLDLILKQAAFFRQQDQHIAAFGQFALQCTPFCDEIRELVQLANSVLDLPDFLRTNVSGSVDHVRDGRHGHARYPSNILDRRHAFRPPAQNTFAFIIQIPFSIVNKICANAGFGIYAAKRLGLCGGKQEKPNIRKSDRRYPEILVPGEKVQVDVKEVPYNCLKGAARRDEKHLYRWTAIDECTRIRFIYGFVEHTPENSVKFFKMLQKIFPFKIQTIQTDNGTEFTYKYISDTELCPFDIALKNAGVEHKLVPPRTPWHNGKVERSHRNDQRYFYNWEKFASVEDLNRKLKDHLRWSNRKPMRTLGGKSPLDLLREILSNA